MLQLYKNIRKQRIALKMTQSDLAEKLGYADKSMIAKIEKGNVDLPQSKIMAFAEVLRVLPGDLMGWEPIMETSYNGSEFAQDDDVSFSEFEHIKKYRSLDKHGREMVDFTLEKEYERTRIEKESRKNEKIVSIRRKQIQYYPRLASAGTGQIVFNGIPMDFIEIEDTPEYRNVRFAIGVNGNSMEPIYRDGDTLLVEPTQHIEVGQTGIFMLDGESYVKKLGDGVLESENPKYKDIPITENTYCLGRVVDCIQSSESKLEDMALRGKRDGDKELKRLLTEYMKEKEAQNIPFKTINGDK